MKIATVVGISALFWVGASLYFGQLVAAAIFAVGHVLFWQNHVLEVKVNKLLDDRGLFVPQYEVER